MVEATIDSVAKKSVFFENLLIGRSSFPIQLSVSYQNIFESAVGNVVGEMSIIFFHLEE